MARPATRSSPPQVLEFATNSLRNTTIASTVDDIYYEIVTRFWHPNLTKINRLDTESRALRTVAEIKREVKMREDGRGGEMVRAVTVRFTKNPLGNEVWHGEEGKEFGDWIKAERFVRGDLKNGGGFFTDDRGEQYKWKTHKNRLQLVKVPSSASSSLSDSMPSDEGTPLALHHSHRRHFYFFRMSKPAILEFEPEAEWKGLDFDKLVVSYLLMERERRDSSILRVYPRV